MNVALLGEKIGMTQVFDDNGTAHGVTVIQLGPCQVLQVKTPEKDGYHSIQIGFKDKPKKSVSQAELGHVEKAKAAPKRYVKEIRQEGPVETELGAILTVDLFKEIPAVDVIGTMKGRGFAGAMKRHGFSGLEKGHGVQRKHRAPGSIGSNTSPGHVRKGVRMNAQYGNTRTTVRNLKVVRVDPENNLILVEGGVPGPNGGFVIVRKTNKKLKYVAPGAAPPSKKKK
jgi:large subunit ribosomal protein L3